MTTINDFTFGDETGIWNSCSATINGKMMIFGGAKELGRQISIVESCQLKRVSSLFEEFQYGGCNTFETNYGSEETMLCFSKNNPSGCQR